MALTKANLDAMLDTTTSAGDAQRVLDALCGLAGMETVTDSLERRKIATQVFRQWVRSQVDAWERIVAQRSASQPAPPSLG